MIRVLITDKLAQEGIDLLNSTEGVEAVVKTGISDVWGHQGQSEGSFLNKRSDCAYIIYRGNQTLTEFRTKINPGKTFPHVFKLLNPGYVKCLLHNGNKSLRMGNNTLLPDVFQRIFGMKGTSHKRS